MNAPLPLESTVRNAPATPTKSRTSLLISLLFAGLLGTGLHLEWLAGRNWNSGEIVLLAHLLLGLVFAVLLAGWIGQHVRSGLRSSQRPAFTWLSWLLLGKCVLLLLGGVLMILPVALYLSGVIWFWSFETTELLAFLHLWAAYLAGIGLLAHLLLRHWRHAALTHKETQA